MQFLIKVLTAAAVFSAPMLMPSAAIADRAACESMFKASPTRVGNFDRTGDKNYEIESPGYGYAVTYRGDAGSADAGSVTVFYYDTGAARVSDSLVSRSFEKAMDDIRRVAKKNDRGVGKFRKSTVNDDGTAVRLVAVAKDTNQRMQLVAMGAKNDCMLKIRLSTSTTREETKQLLTRFMSALESEIYNAPSRGSGKKS